MFESCDQGLCKSRALEYLSIDEARIESRHKPINESSGIFLRRSSDPAGARILQDLTDTWKRGRFFTLRYIMLL